MKKLLNILLLIFVLLSFGFHLANGTKIYMIHPPIPHALSTTIERSAWWNNEIWVGLEKEDLEFYYKESLIWGTYNAWLNGPNVEIKFSRNAHEKDDDDTKGMTGYNKMCDFFNEHGVPFTSRWEYIPADETDTIETTDWFHYYWTVQQEYIKYVKIN